MLKVNHLSGFSKKPPVIGGGVFAPDDVTGIIRWFKADDEAYADNDPVGTLTDKTATANGSASGSERATFKTNIINGKSVYRFDGSDDCYALGNLSALTAGEVFVVIKIDADPPGAAAQTGLWDMGNAADCHFPYTDGTIYDDFGTDSRKTTVDPTPSLASTFRIYNVWSAANDWASNLDGANLHTTGTNTVSFDATAQLGTSTSLGSYFLDGDIAEFVLFDNKISGGDRASMVSYFQSEYGL